MSYPKIEKKHYLTPVRFFVPKAGVYDVNGKVVKLEDRIYTLSEIETLPKYETTEEKVRKMFPGS